MRLAFPLLVLVLVAGCIGADAPEAEPDPVATPTPSATPAPSPATPTPATPTPTTRPAPTPPSAAPEETAPLAHVERVFEVNVTESRGALMTPSLTNCVEISAEGGLRIVAGNATATWSAVAPTAARLELVASEGGGEIARAAGASPLNVTLPAGDHGEEPLHVLVQLPEDATGAAVQQVTLRIAFSHRGAAPAFQVMGCRVA